LTDRALWQSVAVAGEAQELLIRAQERFRLSTRGIVRVLKVALTIADIERTSQAPPDQPAPDNSDPDHLAPNHLAEALQLRRLDRPLSADTV
jgi:predicted ATPase with chaperone activity